LNQFLNRPDVIGQFQAHGRRAAKRGMHLAKVVGRNKQADRQQSYFWKLNEHHNRETANRALAIFWRKLHKY